jgi:nicotinate-nucleotide--dimethylbenzimidazole phosphoribosyltransferase
MTWDRPVPLVGDTSTARQRKDAPQAWALDEKDRAAFYATVHGRRDIRRFRPDPIEVDVLRRILVAAHAAPSVGHSQPWRFVVVRNPATRERAALLADREWHRQAARLAERPGRQMLDLQLHGLREAPVGVVVCCDRRTPPEGVLGRATFVDADLWSCACAIENLWLAARAEGVGVGWVTLFRPEELASLVELPAGVVTLGWLCLGWPDERPPEPGLERSGWSVRQPLGEVVLWERWREGGPASPPSHLPDAADASLRAPAPAAVVRARDQADVLLTPPGSLGVLDRAVDRLAALGLLTGAKPSFVGPAAQPAVTPKVLPSETRQVHHPVSSSSSEALVCPVTLIIAAAGHPVTRHGVTTYADSVTRDVLEATVAGRSLGAVTAGMVGATTIAIDAGVPGDAVAGAISCRPRGNRGDLVEVDAMDLDDAVRLVSAGQDLAHGLGSGIVALGEVGMGNTTVAAALVVNELDLPAQEVVGLGAGGDSVTMGRKRRVVESAVARAQREHPELRHRPDDDPKRAVIALAALGGPEIAVLTGVVLGAAEAGSLVVVDGLVTATAAMTAVAMEPAVAVHLVAGQQSREQAHGAVNAYLGLEPILSLRIRAGEGVGALLATQLLRTAAAVRSRTARTRER